MTPVQPAQRIEILDLLRGAALFGILASNMRAFHSPMPAYFDHTLMWAPRVGPTAVHRAVDRILDAGRRNTLTSQGAIRSHSGHQIQDGRLAG